MKGLLLCVLAVVLLAPSQGLGEDEDEQTEQLMESLGLQEAEESLECFRCDLGFWDACYTTTTNCSLGERCYTGRGKAADTLDIKTLGCVKAEECDVETTVEMVSNTTIFVMTKHCCDTPFCNSATTPPASPLPCLAVAALTAWQLTGAALGSQ